MSQAVHDMFQDIAPRYDLANDVLSFGIHRLWRERALSIGEAGPGMRAVDLCTGTGDVALALSKRLGTSGSVIGVDFVREMLNFADKKPAPGAPIRYVHADASQTGLPDSSADIVTISFGIRNVDDPRACLREMRRLLTSGGRAIILEFGQPTNRLFAALYQFYSFRILPLIGGVLTGHRAAYEYLPRTSWSFPSGEQFLQLMRDAGYSKVSATPVLFGLAYIYRGDR